MQTNMDGSIEAAICPSNEWLQWKKQVNLLPQKLEFQGWKTVFLPELQKTYLETPQHRRVYKLWKNEEIPNIQKKIYKAAAAEVVRARRRKHTTGAKLFLGMLGFSMGAALFVLTEATGITNVADSLDRILEPGPSRVIEYRQHIFFWKNWPVMTIVIKKGERKRSGFSSLDR